MAMVLQILLRLCSALALVVGMTVQLMPCSMAAVQTTVSGEMAGGCPGPQPPCSGQMPNCIDHAGCITVCALSASPATITVPVEWTPLGYDLAPQAFAGIAVKPELSPPILAA